MKQYYYIKEISDMYNIGIDSLRYYEKIGLLHPKRGDNGYRLYTLSDIYKLNLISDLKSLDLSMKQIKVYLDEQDAVPLDEVINSIENADIIIMGPGSLYTSIIPNLLVKGVVDAIEKSKAPKVYICNIMTQPGETDSYNVLDHVNAIVKHTNKNIIDYIISNNEVLPKEMLRRYQKDGAKQVLLDDKQKKILKTMGAKTIEENLIEIKNNYIRHDAGHISDIVINLALRHDNDKNK